MQKKTFIEWVDDVMGQYEKKMHVCAVQQSRYNMKSSYYSITLKYYLSGCTTFYITTVQLGLSNSCILFSETSVHVF